MFATFIPRYNHLISDNITFLFFILLRTFCLFPGTIGTFLVNSLAYYLFVCRILYKFLTMLHFLNRLSASLYCLLMSLSYLNGHDSPIRSLIESGFGATDRQDVRLYYGARNLQRMAYQVSDMSSSFDHGRYS